MSDDEKPSKTQRKKDVHALRDLGAELVDLSDDRLAVIELPERLLDAVIAARRITAHGARRRQMQYIGKIMRKVDAEPIRAALDAWRTKSDSHTAEHKRIEAWRERLLADADAVGALVAEYPAANVSKLRTLIDAAKRERAANQPPRAYRQLYQALRSLIEKDEG